MASKYGQWKAPSDIKESIFKPLCHPLYPKISKEVDEFFLKHWKFPDENSRRKFVDADFCGWTCLCYPLALDERAALGCKFITHLFLVDDQIDLVSLKDAQEYIERLILIIRGVQKPDRSIPAEWIMWDIWEEMRAVDAELAHTLEEPTFILLRAQVDKTRLDTGDLATYFQFRVKDIGTENSCALMQFCMGIHMTDEERRLALPVTLNFGRHLICINDVYSYEKEVRVQDEGKQEGGVLVSAVPIVAKLVQVDIESAKRIILMMCREWETNHHRLVAEILKEHPSPAIETFCKGIEYQYSGNELWSNETPRYNESQA
ncbi:Aristolochene synthase in complex with 12,13-Difluorofarnesyl diphosphate [Biscogniauxia mediterranea]|nr:Aristolochene synthase in complex with 12,13-Difluorofarnesyl diphosphate [Biscogniauxia mediterranea]